MGLIIQRWIRYFKSLKRLRRWFCQWNPCYTYMRNWVQSPWTNMKSWVWWHVPVSPVLRRQWQTGRALELACMRKIKWRNNGKSDINLKTPYKCRHEDTHLYTYTQIQTYKSNYTKLRNVVIGNIRPKANFNSLVFSLFNKRPSVVAYLYNSGTPNVQASGSAVQGHPRL